MYALCAFRSNPVAASIDTPLHGFLPFPHVDHLHPDWGIALAASANGKTQNGRIQSRIQPHSRLASWQRPGFELGLMMRRAIQENPAATASSLVVTASSPGGRPSASATSTPSPSLTRSASSSPSTPSPKGPPASAARPSATRRPPQPRRSNRALSSRPRQHTEPGPHRQVFVHGAENPWISSFTDAPDVLQFVNPSMAKSFPSSEPVAPTISFEPRFVRSLSPGKKAPICSRSGSRSTARFRISRSIPRLLPLLRHARFARHSATPAPPSS